MKKFLLLIVVFIIAAFLVYKLWSEKDTKPVPPPDQALHIAKNSGPFNIAFAGLMSDYFSLKDALVNWDTLKADQAAYSIAAKADSLPVNLIKADSDLINTARSLAVSMVGEAKGLTGETGIEARRHSFDMLTDELFNLIRTVRYDGQKIYYIRCPMAFNDSVAAYWLSDTRAIINPYLGNKHPVYKSKMVGCGEVTDSVDYGKK
jgi:hypothetical protein